MIEKGAKRLERATMVNAKQLELADEQQAQFEKEFNRLDKVSS